MATSPIWKVYTRWGEYAGATKEIEGAAVLVSFYGAGATIRYGHRWVLWTEGQEICPAAESYDDVGNIVRQRLREHQTAAWLKTYGTAAR